MIFPKQSRLLKRFQFRRVSRYGTQKSGPYLQVQMFAAAEKKLGITVSRRYGNAVKRNRFKRLVREAFRLSDLPSLELSVFPGPKAAEATLYDIKSELEALTAQLQTA